VTYSVEHEQLTLARLLLAEGDTGEALRVIDAVLLDAQAAERDGSVIEARMVRALAHHVRGDEEAAVADLSAVLVSGVDAGFVRLLLDEGEPMAELLRRTIAAGSTEARTLAEHLLARQRRPSVAGSARQRAPEGLSEREVEVLRLLASDLSGPEIAAELYVSVNTLRTHTKRIYSKLTVSTRRAAVARATALGVL
jgi:LuxR family maltose regulon positive regulatory protein